MFERPRKSFVPDLRIDARDAPPVAGETAQSHAGAQALSRIRAAAADHTQFRSLVGLAEGTRVRTTLGNMPVETLGEGLKIITADHGPQPLRAVFRKTIKLDLTDPDAVRNFLCQPVRLRAGALGAQRPARNVLLAPHHLVALPHPDPHNGSDVFIAARALTSSQNVGRLTKRSQISYFSLLFDRHVVLFVDGVKVESLRPDAAFQASLSPSERATLFNIRPGLAHLPKLAVGPTARPVWPDTQGARVLAKALHSDPSSRRTQPT
jgi:hypothetical protein